MRPEMFGDSYDFLKKTLIQTLAEGWMTHPMYFDTEPQQGFVQAHAQYLGVGLEIWPESGGSRASGYTWSQQG